ncbi:MAG: hdc [Gammaproteobacteria bacterium]|jgi:histidine decarboxylase|nr:hdc [Gammaproteobacteria bacterium]
MAKNKIPDSLSENINRRLHSFKVLLHRIKRLARHKLGYPVSLLSHVGIISNQVFGIKQGSLANILLNNVGDPFKDSETSLMEVKKHERMLIKILAKFYGLAKDDARGYVTTGGTEGNFAGIWWSKRYLINYAMSTLLQTDDAIKLQSKEEKDLLVALAKIPNNDYLNRSAQLQKILDTRDAIAANKNIMHQLLTPTVFFTKDHTHYSVPKVAEMLNLNIRPIQGNPDGSMDINNFKKNLILNIAAHPYSPIIVVCNIGTTITGTIDDIPSIKKILDNMEKKPHFTIHMDGALTGFVLPVLRPFGGIKNYFEELGVNTLAFSAHKYLGLSQPCGIILSRKNFFEKAFEKAERSVEYVGNIIDSTVTGSRSGLNVLMFYNALCSIELDKNKNKLTKMVADNFENAKYLYAQLVKILGPDQVEYPYNFNVIFSKPSLALSKKYQLMLRGETATICVLSNVTKELIDQFINDLQLDREMTMNKLEYTICTLTVDHQKSAVDLFTKSFCDSEPITKYLGIKYDDYEVFAKEVVKKAVHDGMSIVAVDSHGRVIACAIAEDMADLFQPNLKQYPKLKPIFALLEQLSEPFLSGKKFIKGRVAHIWIAIVNVDYRGKGLSTAIDMACATICMRKGYDFAYAEFTNDISEKITHHYKIYQQCNSINYNEFTYDNQKPFKGLNGKAAAYIIGIKPGVEIDLLPSCYSVTTQVS